MSRRTQTLKILQPLRAVLHYVGVVRGRPDTRQVGEEILAEAIEEHPVGAQMLDLVAVNLTHKKEEERQ